MEEILPFVSNLAHQIGLFNDEGRINYLLLLFVIAVFALAYTVRYLIRFRKQLKKKKTSPLHRNDVINRCREIKQLDLFDGKEMQYECEAKQSYWLSSTYVKDFSHAYFVFKYKGSPIKIHLMGKDVKTVKLCLGDSPMDTAFFSKLDLTQIAKYFGFQLRRDASSNLEAQCGGNALTLSIKKSSGKMFFLFYSIIGSKTNKGVYLFGVYEVTPTLALSEKYNWLR